MELSDSPETRKLYPFRFAHQVKYELRDGALIFHQHIENRSEQPMPFSTGIHPYFKVPLTAAGSRAECFVEFGSAQRAQTSDDWQTWSNADAGETGIPVSRDASGTFFVAHLSPPEIRLIDPGSDVRVVIGLKEAPAHKFVALWAKSVQEPYYCIEPWTALPNSFARSQPDLLRLAAGGTFSAEISILVQ